MANGKLSSWSCLYRTQMFTPSAAWHLLRPTDQLWSASRMATVGDIHQKAESSWQMFAHLSTTQNNELLREAQLFNGLKIQPLGLVELATAPELSQFPKK